MKYVTLLLLSSLLSGCGIWWAEWRGDILKVKLTKEGEAILLREENEKLVLIEEAKAKLEAAKYNAKAEIERAKGVAEANKIIGSSLKGNESYLRYLWINNLDKGNSEVIYVPTEANLPILESTRSIRK